MSKTETKKMVSETQEQKTIPKEPQTVIYIGPTIKGVATEGTVYNNGIPPELEEKARVVPAVKALIIPVEKLPQANTELAKKGSALSILYQKVQR